MDVNLDALDNLGSVMDGILDSVDIFQMNDLAFNEFDLQRAIDRQLTEGSDSDSGISVSGEKNANVDFLPLGILGENQLCDQSSRTSSDEILTDVICRSNPVSIKPEPSEKPLSDSNLPHATFQRSQHRVTPLSVNGPIRLVTIGASNSVKVKTLVQPISLAGTSDATSITSKTDATGIYSLNLHNKTSSSRTVTLISPNQRTLTIPSVKVTPTAIIHKDSRGQESTPFSNSHKLTLLNDFCPILDEYDGMKYSDSSLGHHLTGRNVAEMHSVDLLLTQTNLERIHKKQERMIKNRHAASLSRLRKKEYLERLEMRYEHLKRENLQLWRQNEEWRLRCVHLERCLDDLQSRLSSVSRDGGVGDLSGVALLPPPPPAPLQLSPVAGQRQDQMVSADPLNSTLPAASPPAMTCIRVTANSTCTSTVPRVSLSTLASCGSSNAGFGHLVKPVYPPPSSLSHSSVSLFSSPLDSRLPCSRTPSPPPVKRPAGIGLYNRSQYHLDRLTSSNTTTSPSSSSSLYKSCPTPTSATAPTSLLLRQKLSGSGGSGGVMPKRPRHLITTTTATTSLLTILCLFSVNTLLLPQTFWTSSSFPAGTGVDHHRSASNQQIGLLASGTTGRRVLLSLSEDNQQQEEVMVVGDVTAPTATRLSVARAGDDDDSQTEGDDFASVDCSQSGNQTYPGDDCGTEKDRMASRGSSMDNSSMHDPDKVLQNWIKRNRRPLDLPRPTRDLRNHHRIRRSIKSHSPRVATIDNGERGIQSTQPFYRFRQDGPEQEPMLDIDDLLLEAAYMIGDSSGGYDQDYGGGSRTPPPHSMPRRNVIVKKNNTVYLLLSGVDFTVIQIPSSSSSPPPPVNSSNGKVARQKMTFILPDSSQSTASFDATEGSDDHFPPTGKRPYQLLQLDCELVNATRIRSPAVRESRHRAPGRV